jgi:tRNA(fMet)-specific endonuclease VapC
MNSAASRDSPIIHLIAPLTVLLFTVASADHSSQVRQELVVLGQSIGPLDTLIAGHALEHQLTLVTGNAREFSSVNGFRLENWT